MRDSDPEQLADELEREAARLQRESDRLRGEIAEAREDWERKRADQSVPGAPARSESEQESPNPRSNPS